MRKKDLKVGLKVYDRWWPWRLGVVKQIRKTSIKVQFNRDPTNFFGDDWTYDLAHLQFLEKYEKRRSRS